MYKIFDLHNDYYLKILNDKKKKKYVSGKKSADGIVSAIWTSEMNENEALSMIEQARDFVNKEEKLLLGIEDLHFLTESNLERLIEFRPAYAGLTWNTCNALAGGAHESGRLTRFGKKVVELLEDNYIKIDLSHLNEASFCDVAKVTSKPLFCSHTACFGICENPRNLKDYQIKMVIDSGGLVGLCLVSDFINGTQKCFVKDLVCQIDYFACRFGIDHLALGTDFYGTSHLPKGIKTYSDLTKTLSVELLKLGYTQKAISKIFYDNAFCFLKNAK